MQADPVDKPRILVLASGSGTNLQALIESTRERDYPGEIVAVGSNRPQAFALERAAQAGIETFTVDHTRFDSREAFDAELRLQMERYQPDLVVLAGFMRILTPELVRAFHGRMLNVHPSLLPKYRGLNTHQRAIDAGDLVHGVSVHFVTEDLDGGPVIARAEVEVRPEDSHETLSERVRQQEHILYPIVVRWFCEGRLQLAGRDRVLFDGQPMPAVMTLPVS